MEQARLFVASAGNVVMHDVARTFAETLGHGGLAAEVRVDALPEAAPPEGVLQLVVAPHEYFPLFAEPAAGPDAVRSWLPALHLLNVEQPGRPWFEIAYGYAAAAGGVLDISALAAGELRRRGIDALHAPLAYVPAEGDGPQGERDVDVVFMGSHSWRREQFFSRHAGLFARFESAILFARLEEPRRAATAGFLCGESRRALLRRARVLVNVHAEETGYFEWHRAIAAAGAGCAIVTEPGDVRPWRAGEDLVVEELDHLAEECRRLLEDEDARLRMATRAWRRMAETLAPDRLGPALVGAVRQRLPKAPGVAVPGPPPGVSTTDWAASAAPSRTPSVPVSSALPAASEASILARQAREARRLQSVALEVQGHRPWDEEALGAAVFDAPAVSVVVTVYDYAGHVGECVDSVLAARGDGIAGGLELVVVDDGSTDGSAAVVRRHAAGAPWPVRLARKRLNTGLADARNLGLRLARGRYVFILDADNRLYPRGLAVLHRAIRGGPHAAVYGIVRKFGPGGAPAGLASCFPWDVRQLVRRPYIDAMALFDREALLSVDGYTPDMPWMGWEDYEVWLKLAQAGHSCALVPQLVAEYRVHGASMIHEARPHTAELAAWLRRRFAVLVERYPDLDEEFGFPRVAVESRQSTVES